MMVVHSGSHHGYQGMDTALITAVTKTLVQPLGIHHNCLGLAQLFCLWAILTGGFSICYCIGFRLCVCRLCVCVSVCVCVIVREGGEREQECVYV